MKKTKKKINTLKLIFTIAGIAAAIAAIAALVTALKKKAEEEKQREAEIEEEIRSILEEKLSCVELEDKASEIVEGEEE